MKGKSLMYLMVALLSLLAFFVAYTVVNLQYSLLAQNASSIQGQIAANRSDGGAVNWTAVLIVLGLVVVLTFNSNRLIRLYPRVVRAWGKSRPKPSIARLRPANTITLAHAPAVSVFPTPEPQEEVVEVEVNNEPQNYHLDF